MSSVETTALLIVMIVCYIIIDIWLSIHRLAGRHRQPRPVRADIRRIRPRFLNIDSECPRTRWGGQAFERKSQALQRRVKAAQRLGYICGINGIYVYTVPVGARPSDVRLHPTR
jgi:hypothetical protein